MPSKLLPFLILLAIHLPSKADDPARPNIVFILADDLGINDLHCYGRTEHQTPNLDQLAREGMRFTNAYAAQSVCSPTRASILTGFTPARLNITTFLPGRSNAPSQMLLHPTINQQLPSNYKTLANSLKTEGYTSACIGKWHLGGNPVEQGFDVYYPGQATTPPTNKEGGKGEFDLTQAAEQFLDQHQSKPFFLYLAHNNPHIPLGAQPERIKKFADTFNPTYAAMIETLDESVGRIMKKLDALKLTKNTLFIFMSDNGGLHVLEGGQTPTHNTPYRAGKGFLYEGGIRVPLIVRWPGKVKPDSTSNVPVISTDITPTLLAVLGEYDIKGEFDGINLLDYLTLNKMPAPRPLYWHQPHYMNQGSRPCGAIREGNWKLIEHYENGQLELFNLEKDIGETTDVSEKEPNRVADLRGKLEKWRREVHAQPNMPNPQFNYAFWKPLYVGTDVSKLPTAAKSEESSKRLESWRAAMNVALGKDVPPGIGAIYLRGKDAILYGEKLRFEPEPHKDTIGYWANMNDWAEWKVRVPKAGVYAVELLQGAGKGSGGAEVEISIADQTLKHTVKETGHFQCFVPITVDTVRLEEGVHVLTIRAKTKPGFGVMDLRQVVLRGVGEKR
ncbi:MAG TPA: sulfatase-like hydrolase/transferase [Gemmatales bacterium]|nr:sulfatase-like hydrolase/transferase [Gemmatales bacterium]